MGQYGGRDSLEKEKYLANSYTAAKVNVNYKLSSFFKCYFRSETEILMEVCSFWIIFHKSFLEMRLHISMNGRFIFSGGFIFRWRGHSIGVASALTGGRGDKKIHGMEGTPIIPLPTRANPALCCNRIKKKHELQYGLGNLQKKDLNFIRKDTSSQINF